MSRSAEIAVLLRRTITGPMWHGPAVGELLRGVSADQASKRPIGGAHSIWELVNHMTTWSDIALDRLRGARPSEIPPERDFPPVRDVSEDAWREAMERLERSYAALAGAVEQLDSARLEAHLPGVTYSAATLLHGVAEHGCYHGGQIAILKRALSLTPSP